MDFFSIPVTAGFVSAAAITIASNQVQKMDNFGDYLGIKVSIMHHWSATLVIYRSYKSYFLQVKSLLGLTITTETGYPGVVGTYGDVFANITSIRLNDTLLGISCIVVLVSLRVN